MSPEKEHIKVLSILSLAASDTRIDTLKSVVLSTLKVSGRISESEISAWIEELFGFKPYKGEISQIINELVDDGEIEKSKDKFINITSDTILKIGNAETKLKDRDKQRFDNFSSFIIEEFGDIGIVKTKLLWATFIEFLYNHFFDYGEEALSRLHPHIEFEKRFDKEDEYLKIAFTMLKDEKLCQIFKFAVEKFPDYASSNDIDFLNDLALKTLSFASLGIDPNLADQAINLSLVDWVLYLDTNVLYSLLNLHAHPENDACKALVSLINENKEHLNISLRYSEMTKKELNKKRNDFGLLDDKMTSSSIKALLRSNKLDDFAHQFYSNLLNNKEATLHPSKIIDLSPNLLKKVKIDIARNAKRIDEIEDEYLKARIQDYHVFLSEKNKIRQEFCERKDIPFHPIYRSDNQVLHDITLRELILHLRKTNKKKGDHITFNNIKYFGITLDGLLRDYDTSRIKDFDDEQSFPVFFRPSFLLTRLVKVLPVKTNDYKKAFIKAVTSKGFNKDVKKSHDIQKIVNFLKTQGIDNEDLIYNLISKDLFLEKYNEYSNKEDFDKKEFIESELNREFKKKDKELNEIKEKIEIEKQKSENNEEQKSIREEKYSVLESQFKLYQNAVKSLKSEIDKLKSGEQKTKPEQKLIDFEKATLQKELDKKNTQLKSQIEEDIILFKSQRIKNWQRLIWWNLIWVIPLTAITFLVIFNPEILLLSKQDITSIKIILGFFALLFDGLFVYLIKSRYFDENNKRSKYESLILSKELKERQQINM